MTLTRAYCSTIPRCPSQRYTVRASNVRMPAQSSICSLQSHIKIQNILLDGAREANLPAEYQAFLEALLVYKPPRTTWRLIGAAIFLTIWVPFMMFAERLTVATAGCDGRGNCPRWVVGVVRFILWAMWLHHDRLHARLFDPGDGRDQNKKSGIKYIRKARADIFSVNIHFYINLRTKSGCFWVDGFQLFRIRESTRHSGRLALLSIACSMVLVYV